MLAHRDELISQSRESGVPLPPPPDPPRPGEGPGLNIVRMNKVGDQVVSR
jgi:hypothetical protein